MIEPNLILKEIKKYINFIFIIFMVCTFFISISMFCFVLPYTIYINTQNYIFTTIASIFTVSTTLYVIFVPKSPKGLRQRPSFYGRSPPVGNVSNPSSPPPPKK